MLPKQNRPTYVCQECGAITIKWMGRCPTCDAWNSIIEEAVVSTPSHAISVSQPPVCITASLEDAERQATGWGEFDRVLGGGIITGSLILLGGEPGVGKSTLLLQVARAYAERWGKVLYISAEESVRQVQLRAHRLGAVCENLYVLNETDLTAILAQVDTMQPQLIVIDSIQTVACAELSSAAGSISQVTACTQRLMQVAKSTNTTFIIVGHVNKAGALAGPKVLEHAVDVVLSFEGEKHTPYRLLRATKNRHGSTYELGVFTMEEQGLVEVANPSACFLAERPEGTPGTAVVACMEGMRPVLVEVQALVSVAPFGGTPRRQMAGVDRNRAAIVLAVLEKRAGLQLQTQDVYINVAGGLAIDEPAADLGIALAVASSYRGLPLPPSTLIFGEIGLAGELRSVAHTQRRLAEAEAMGFSNCVIPQRSSCTARGNIKLVKVARLLQALGATLPSG